MSKAWAFLNKKGWHTGTIKNSERVWLAEQKHAAEQKKVQELQKEIEDERQVEQLRALQREHGLLPTTSVDRVDWMYRSVQMELDQKEKEKEEYLLGKKVPDGPAKISAPPTLDKAAKEDTNGAARWVQKYENRDLDAEARIREDPMLVSSSKYITIPGYH